MRNGLPIRSSAVSLISALLFASTLHLPNAQATTELDRIYALETVGYLKSWDNVDGMFVDYVSTAYKEYFAKQSRFVLQDLTRGSDILAKSKLPYNKLIDD